MKFTLCHHLQGVIVKLSIRKSLLRILLIIIVLHSWKIFIVKAICLQIFNILKHKDKTHYYSEVSTPSQISTRNLRTHNAKISAPQGLSKCSSLSVKRNFIRKIVANKRAINQTLSRLPILVNKVIRSFNLCIWGLLIKYGKILSK
jgi:hypothetical protein